MAQKSVYCSVCDQSIKSKAFSAHLRSNMHKNNNAVQLTEDVEKLCSAFRSRIVSYRVRASGAAAGPAGTDAGDERTPADFLAATSRRVRQLIAAKQEQHINIKVNFELFAEFVLPKSDTVEIKSFATSNVTIHQNYDFDEIFMNAIQNITKKIDEFQERDSGWSFLRNLYLEVNINKYSPLRASSYIELPKCLKYRRACINIKNTDNFCFVWSIMAALFPAKSNPERTSSYPDYNTVLDLNKMTFPVSFSDIKIFEKNNCKISVNIYGLNKNKKIVGPLYRTQQRKKYHVNLLLLENNNHSHYCLIKDLGRLVRPQVTKHHGKIYFCDDCLLFFNSEHKLNEHKCGGVATLLPEKGSFIQFKHYERMQDMPFVIYADFESYLEPCKGENERLSSFTTNVHKHIPAAFGYYIVCSHDSSLNKYVSYRGQDCIQKFIEFLQKDISKIYALLNKCVPMIFTEEDAENFEKARDCSICSLQLFDDKVRDHCHLTGKYRGAAHSFCNIKFAVPKLIPVFFHNLSGYDAHLFIRELGVTSGRIKVIAKNKENYISFTKFFLLEDGNYAPVRFVDSFKFLGTSLEKLVENLNRDEFHHLSYFYPDSTKFNLLKRKGVYPYEYVNSWDSYNDTRLPSKKNFFSSLTNKHISEQDYIHALNVWNIFNIRTLGEYTDLYLQTDVLLLADVFQNFRLTCRKNYKLDPAFYLTSPSLSFDAMLLKTGVHLQLIDNLEILRMIQSGIRGGVCLCSTRYAKSNNKYLNDYNRDEPDNYLIYIDCNNLYGHSLSAFLPYSDFRLLSKREINVLDVYTVPNNNEYGYILEVDLEYPETLHDLHNDIPFCPQKFIPPGSKTPKLIPNLYDKFRYVIHYVHLKECLKHGLKLLAIHRVIKFKQSAYLKQYIDLNTRLRQNATSTFEQDFFKLLNNSIFGKTLEDSEKRLDVKLVNRWKDERNVTKKMYTAEQLIAKPNFHSLTIFDENLIAVQMNPERVILDKPIYIGFTVLELSKSHMYNFHYSIMKPFYGPKLKLCYTDTDSFLYSIQTEDFYKDLKIHFKQFFDTSNYPENNEYNIERVNKKIPGLFKDEMGGELIVEFVGLRSKLYCIKTESSEIKKAKGVKKCVLKDINFKDYNEVLTDKDLVIRRKNILFKSLKHQIFTRAVDKVALSSNDDKRRILEDNISTYAWGHEAFF